MNESFRLSLSLSLSLRQSRGVVILQITLDEYFRSLTSQGGNQVERKEL